MERGREPSSRPDPAPESEADRADVPPTDEAGAPAADRAGAIEALLVECLAREGDELTAALEAACARRPDLAAELRERVAWLRERGLVEPPMRQLAEGDAFAGFRLVRRLGGGGMGLVHLAEETALGRRVALKTVRPEHLFFPDSRERFFREVRTVAQLKHSAIVPVYSVGEHSGVPYFTMEWIEGCTLAEMLEGVRQRPVETLSGRDAFSIVRERAGPGDAASTDAPAPLFESTWVDFALRITAAVADALAHAHAAGVLHRDVKPSNVMLARDGRVLLLDFGLASAPETDKITRSGSPLGSVPYMSPEQVRSERLDERTDVYSLGATLYELLTLREAFRGKDAASTWQFILRGELPSARSLHRGLPADVDAVCRTAMDVDRERRYASMSEFRDDLQRLLQRRPILARPPGPLLRARRFVQRHPTLAATAALLLLIAAGVPTLLFVRERSARRKIELEADTARETVAILEELVLGASPASGLGVNAPIGELLASGVAGLETRLRDRPELRRRLLGVLGRVYSTLKEPEKALPLLDEAIVLSSGDGVDREDVRLRMHRAISLWALARFEEAEQAFQELLGRSDLTLEWRVQTLAQFGTLCLQRGRKDEAEQCLRESIALAQQLDHSTSRAVAFTDYAAFLLITGQAEAALEWSERAADAAAADFRPGHPVRAGAEDVRIQALLAAGRVDEAKELGDRSIAQIAQQVAPDSLSLVQPLRTAASIAARRHDFDGEAELLRRALAIVENRLPDDHPLLAWVLDDLGVSLDRAGRNDEAIVFLDRAAAVARMRPSPAPAHLAGVLAHAAEGLSIAGRKAQACALADEAIALLRAAPQAGAIALGCVLRISGWVEQMSDRFAVAEERQREAIALLETQPAAREELGRTCYELALTLNRVHRSAEAEELALRGLGLLRSIPSPEPLWIANAHYHVGWSRFLLGRLEEAEQSFRESIAIYDATTPDYSLEAFPLSGLAELLVTDRPAESIPLLERALAIRRRTQPAGDYWLGTSRHNLAAAWVRVGRVDEAVALFEESIAARREHGAHGDELLAAGLYELARIRARREELDEAAGLAREAVAEASRVASPRNQRLLPQSKLLLASLLVDLDELSEAEPLLLEANMRSGAPDPDETLDSRRALHRLAERYEQRGDAERAAGVRRVLEATAAIR